MKLTMLLTNAVRAVALPARASNAESLPSFQPPTEIDTLTPCAWPCDTIDCSFAGLSSPCRLPLLLGRMNA